MGPVRAANEPYGADGRLSATVSANRGEELLGGYRGSVTKGGLREDMEHGQFLCAGERHDLVAWNGGRVRFGDDGCPRQ